MGLIVEDGSGKPDAESYASVAELIAYANRVGFDVSGFDEVRSEQALRRGTRWIDQSYGASFLGCWATTTQALEWPRSGVTYRKVVLPLNAIPDALKEATIEAAFRELTRRGSLLPDDTGARLKRDKVGDVDTEFALSRVRASLSIPIVDGLLRGLTVGNAGGYVGRAVRA